MLPKKRRISKKEFSQIIKGGKRYNSHCLMLFVVRMDSKFQHKESKFSFSLSKKVSPGAVSRNKNRRRGYSVIGQNIQNIKPGFLLLFSFKKGSAEINFSDLNEEIIKLLSISSVLR